MGSCFYKRILDGKDKIWPVMSADILLFQSLTYYVYHVQKNFIKIYKDYCAIKKV